MATSCLLELPGRTPDMDQKSGYQQWTKVHQPSLCVGLDMPCSRTSPPESGRPCNYDTFIAPRCLRNSLSVISTYHFLYHFHLFLSAGKCTCWNGIIPTPTSAAPSVLPTASTSSSQNGTSRNSLLLLQLLKKKTSASVILKMAVHSHVTPSKLNIGFCHILSLVSWVYIILLQLSLVLVAAVVLLE